ncbi:glucosamine-6-phosphate deaminase [Paenibacillus thalictri]|uniref:Glucosamine-6-phosphate deaminase n=1 Tax=Paenibacillus thalictri TaxID=2527873 RepID=A0A4Q9DRG5_9BACL|nr:glucosamine-6-phosphate deaminase [Paenibacillus thalictri]TBL77349.1 glucosamine-6-phosphate deaminase [Paenibacillus thalictri]
MKVHVLEDAQKLGEQAAEHAANIINELLAKQDKVRLVLSTGASQFETLSELVKKNIEWSRIEMFHLDEYIGLPESHPASFRKYLKERFVQLIPLGKVHFVNGEGNITEHLEELTREITKEPVDLALIGIGENGHIAFNDPPADFETKQSYMVVDLDDICKKQQVGEGWFPTVEDVPKQAITMTVHQIMKSRTILSCVPNKVKAKAIREFFENDIDHRFPSTIMKSHPNLTLYLDKQSASQTDPKWLL